MSITVDTNLLLYASDTYSPSHARAVEALRACATGPEPLYLFWPVLMGYLRIATHPTIFDEPLSPREAMGNLESLLQLPGTRCPGEDEGFWKAFGAVTRGRVVQGNLVPDAHIVALMRLYGVRTIWTSDRDFRGFDWITVRNPLADEP
ncbi:MAG TPA: TA system VapC family ribonuclease toxin [Actinomycetota bacterium]